MKHICRVALLLALIAPVASTLAGQIRNAHYEFISPLPGARFVPAETDIALRPGRALDPGETVSGSTLSVTGSISGSHSVSCILSDDRRTLIFRPDRPFAMDETVSVQFPTGSRTSSGRALESLSYTFTTRARRADLTEQASIFDELLQGAAPKSPRVPSAQENLRSTLDTLPADFPRITVTSFGKTAYPGELFLANMTIGGTTQSPYLIIATTDGTPLWYRKMKEQCLDFKRQPNGLLTYYDRSLGCYLAMDSTYAVVDTFRCGNGYSTDGHELQLLPNGHALLMSYDAENYAMDTVVTGGNPNALVTGLIIQELDLNKNVVFQWRSWDHVKITDAIAVNLTAAVIDYIHGNALELDYDGNILLSSRHFSEITKIDRQTGDIIWRLGGKNNQFRFTNDTLMFSYQHAIRRIPNGHITLFDNGNGHQPKFSRGLEYALDEQNKTATLVWEYRHSPSLFGPATGYVQRLEDGSTLIDWGSTSPNVTLVAPDNTATFDLSFPPGLISYRAFLYPPLVASGVREQNSGVPAAYYLEQNYPNPFNPGTTIAFHVPKAGQVRLRVYDITGREVATLANDAMQPGSYEARFDGSRLASGIYFYQLTAGKFVETRKMMLVK